MFTRAINTMRSLKNDNSAVALVEFGLSAPLVLAMGLGGTETANYTITHMQISQVAMQVADSASRVGEGDVVQARQVFEDDLNDVFIGAEKLGENYDIFGQGRIILSSLQRNAEGGQWIAWQRCRGAKNIEPLYGVAGDGATGTDFPGMGDDENPIVASPGTAVMFVEVSYTYESLTPFQMYEGTEFFYTAAFNVRDARDLRQVFQRPDPVPVARCDTFSADRPT